MRRQIISMQQILCFTDIILLEQMGTPSSNCFRSKDQYEKATANKNQKGSSHSLPTANVKIWKQSLGMIERKQIIDFQYPKNIVHPTFRNVEKDITRTFPDCSFFGGKKLHLETFAHVLKKLAVYFPNIGYIQGMNFIVGFFLLSGLNADQTFTISVKVLTNYDLMCLGLYEECFPLTRFYCSLVWQILEVANPSIKKKINQFSILDDLWMFQWFTTLFIYSFPFETIPQIWTFLFVNKQFASVRIVSAIVLLLWPYMQKCEFDIDFMNLISQLKNEKSFNKKLKVKDILQKASEIKNEDIIKLVPQVQQYGKNKYAVFFSLAENDRKIKYLQFLSELSRQRQQFLKNSKGYKFDRKQSDIEVIDSIQINQAKMLHQSFTYRIKSNPTSQQILNEKLWKSDVYKLMTEVSKKTIEQPKTSNSNENLSVINKNDDVLDNQAPGLILNPSLLLNEQGDQKKQHGKKC